METFTLKLTYCIEWKFLLSPAPTWFCIFSSGLRQAVDRYQPAVTRASSQTNVGIDLEKLLSIDIVIPLATQCPVIPVPIWLESSLHQFRS